MDLLQTYWPLALVIIFLGYRYYKNIKLKKLLPELKKRGAQIIDVRSVSEFNLANNPSSINIPLSDFKNNLNKLNIDVPIIVCCASGARSASAGRLLKAKGYEVYNAGNWSNTF